MWGKTSRAALRANFICSPGRDSTTTAHTFAHWISIMCPCRSRLFQCSSEAEFTSSATSALAALSRAYRLPTASRTSLARAAGLNFCVLSTLTLLGTLATIPVHSNQSATVDRRYWQEAGELATRHVSSAYWRMLTLLREPENWYPRSILIEMVSTSVFITVLKMTTDRGSHTLSLSRLLLLSRSAHDGRHISYVSAPTETETTHTGHIFLR